MFLGDCKKDFTLENFPCFEGGENCLESIEPFPIPDSDDDDEDKIYVFYFFLLISVIATLGILSYYNRKKIYAIVEEIIVMKVYNLVFRCLISAILNDSSS